MEEISTIEFNIKQQILEDAKRCSRGFEWMRLENAKLLTQGGSNLILDVTFNQMVMNATIDRKLKEYGFNK